MNTLKERNLHGFNYDQENKGDHFNLSYLSECCKTKTTSSETIQRLITQAPEENNVIKQLAKHYNHSNSDSVLKISP